MASIAMGLTPYSFEEWRYMASPFWEVSLVNESTRFFSELSFTSVEDLVIGKSRFAAQVFDHNPPKIRGIDHEYIYVERYLSGHNRGLADGQSTHIDCNVIQLIDLTRRYQSITSDVCAVGTLIPHTAVGYDPGRHPAYISMRLDTAAGRVLGECHESLLKANASGSADAGLWAQSFKCLVRTLMLREPDEVMREQAPAIGRSVVKSFIGRHLDDPELTVNGICRTLGISRSALYRLFEPDGGIVNYIRDRRLDRCFANLLDHPHRWGRVRSVAEDWCFFDPANFNRAFRTRFGVAPSECRMSREQQELIEPPNLQHPVHDWMGK